MATPARALPQRRFGPPAGLSGPQLGLILLVLVGMALAGNYLAGRLFDDGKSETAAVQSSPVQRRTVESTVATTGTVSATKQVRLTFLSAGQVQELYVKLGDKVAEGQPLAALNTFNLEVKRDQARSNLNSAQLRLEALLNGPTTSDLATAQQSVAGAQSTLTKAQNDYLTLISGATADEINQVRAALERAEANLAVAQTNYDKLATGTDLTLRPEYTALQQAQSGYQQALASYTTRTTPNPLDVSNAQATLQSAQAGLASARAKLGQVLAGPDPLDLSNAQTAVTSARAGLTSAQARLTALLAGPDPLEVANAQAQVTAAEASLNTAQARLTTLQNPAPAANNVPVLQAQLESARAALRAAEAREQTALNGDASTTNTDLVVARAAVVAAQTAVIKAQADLDAAVTAGAAPSVDLTSARQAITTAETALQTARNNLTRAGQGAPAADLAAAQQAITAAETQVTTTTNALIRLQNSPTAADLAAAQQAVAAAEASALAAQNNLDKLLTGGTPEEIAASRTALETATAALETARTNWNRLISGSDLTTRSEYTQLVAARADYQSALAAYNIRVSGPKLGDIAVAQKNIESAEALVNSSLARLAQLHGGSLPTDIGQAREVVATAELAVKQAQQDLDNTVMKAPFAGTVTALTINPGDQVGTSTAAITILDPALVRVEGAVDEANVTKLKVGQPVNVTFDSLGGRTFQGTIAVVTPAGVTTQGVVTFPVIVVMNTQGVTIPPGTTANLRVITESKPDVLVIPSRAISRQGGQSVVQVLVDGKPEGRTVRTGLTADNNTEILEGLNEGDQVVLPATQQGAAGAAGSTFGAGGVGGFGGAPTGGAPPPPAPAPAGR